MKIIGAVGQNGSGKDEVLKYLRDKYGVPFLATGDMVRAIAAREGKELSRENLREVSESYFAKHGKGCFVKLVAEEIKKNGWQVAGISGIRAVEDINALKEIFGKDFILVNVYVTDPHQRYLRMRSRGEARDPLDYAQFQKQEAAEEKLFHLSDAAKLADYSLPNDGTLDDLHKGIDKVLVKRLNLQPK
ncbi:MAG: AAA family ATPase [Dehalococcoidales bacterium]|nr:AAA family ATPase [Dehalococcoidales bacterium]